MQNAAILFPVLALAAWTNIVLVLVPIVRIRAARKREVKVDDFKYGESSSVPAYVSLPNRNYMNLLELPILFYVICLTLYMTQGTNSMFVMLAWLYVMLRVVHSLIHLSYNKVIHRLLAFAVSNAVLVGMLVLTTLHVAGL